MKKQFTDKMTKHKEQSWYAEVKEWEVHLEEFEEKFR